MYGVHTNFRTNVQKRKPSMTLSVLFMLYLPVALTDSTDFTNSVPDMYYNNKTGIWRCEQPFNYVKNTSKVELVGDNGSCTCDEYCASDWEGTLPRTWRGATSMFTDYDPSAKHKCHCIEAANGGWCNRTVGVFCDATCESGHNYGSANPCTERYNVCTETDGYIFRHKVNSTGLYYCKRLVDNALCSISAPEGPDGPGSYWGNASGVPPCFPVDSSTSSSFVLGWILLTVCFAICFVFLGIVFICPKHQMKNADGTSQAVSWWKHQMHKADRTSPAEHIDSTTILFSRI